MKLKPENFLLLLFLICFVIIALSNQPTTAKKSAESLSPTYAHVEQPVTKIAKQITVRIFTVSGAGSGVIIAREGQTYTVLTCNHVVEPNQQFKVLTPDGKIHKVVRKPIPHLNGVDLALVQFQSHIPYSVARLSKFTNIKEIAVEQPAYASGFPNYHQVSANGLESTFDWGLRAYQLTTGKVSMLLLEHTLAGGYQLGYTNDIELGMSGGPVLDVDGYLIGINGWGKYPFQGIDVFQFTDGTVPSQEHFERMEALSWAIPISTFREKFGKLSISTSKF